MRAIIISSVIGILGYSNERELVTFKLFKRDAKNTAEKIVSLESGKIIKEVTEIVEELKVKDYTCFVFENSKLAQTVKERLGVKIEVGAASEVIMPLRKNMEELAFKTGFLEDTLEIAKWVHDVSMEISQIKVRQAIEKKDLLIVQAVQTLDDMDKTINLFIGRIREWYGLHFPELDRLIEKNEIYVQLVVNLGDRKHFTRDNLDKEKISKKKIKELVNAAETSMGASIDDTDLKQIQELSSQIIRFSESRRYLEKYISELMGEIAPNISSLAGSTLGARLIALAGKLDNLAKMPASTIQVLGAEKALFRSLTTGARPPKHGILFQHSLVHGSKRWFRGKIARAFAGKLAIAARIDAFSKGRSSDKLKEDLQKRIEEIKIKSPLSKSSKKKITKNRRHSKTSSRRKKHGFRR